MLKGLFLLGFTTSYEGASMCGASKRWHYEVEGLLVIYLKERNLIFIEPREVAGTSFEIALSKYAMKHDIITPISPDDEATRRELGC